jgi:hypothetical protein
VIQLVWLVLRLEKEERCGKSALKDQQKAEDQDLGILLAVQEFSLFQQPIGWLFSFRFRFSDILRL